MMKLRIFLLIYIASNLSLIAYGILALLSPGILLNSFSLHVYQFPDYAATAVDYLSALFRLLGFFNLILGILGLILLWQYQIRRQTWILKLVIASALLSYLGPIVFDNTVGSIGLFEIIEHVLFAGMLLSGVIVLVGQDKIESAYEAQ